MELNYTAVWVTTKLLNGKRRIRVTHGKITERDIFEAIQRKEDCNEDGAAYIEGAYCTLQDHIIDAVEL